MLSATFAFAGDNMPSTSSEVNLNKNLVYEYSLTENLAPTCTVSYTNPDGIHFSATASTCAIAYEMIKPHIVAQ